MNGNDGTDIRSLTRSQIEAFLLSHGVRRFRADQVHEWLWKKRVAGFAFMTNLPKDLRELLERHFIFHGAVPGEVQQSSDGTRKAIFGLHDGNQVEAVLIPSGSRLTACVSSQAGCALGCTFCATGKLGFTRNLTAGEIFDQAFGLLKPGEALSNIVFMGMGEPFLNYGEVTAAIDRITGPDGQGMSPQRITVSSVGIPKMIRKMADDRPRYHFALSLHAATDEKRDRIIPFNRQHPLAEVRDAMIHYHKTTGKRFTIEYILLGNFNDSSADASALARFCKNFPVKINLIEYNAVPETGFYGATKEQTVRFAASLEKLNLVVNIRESRGRDIAAACGQLAGQRIRQQPGLPAGHPHPE